MTKPAFGSVDEYLQALAPDKSAELRKLRAFIGKHLPLGFAETISYGMPSYVVPLERYPDGYLNNKAISLPYLAFAAQKNYLSLYLMCIYGNSDLFDQFIKSYRQSGKKLDMGKSCLRFKRFDDLALEPLATAISAVNPDRMIAMYEQSRGKRR